jgi:ribosomal protein S18 acetylase RimI-like enzyme
MEIRPARSPVARIEIRPAGGSDGDAIREFLVGLSLRTRYLRFFAGVGPASPAMLRRLTGGAAPALPRDALAPAAATGTARARTAGTDTALAPAAGAGDHIDALLATEGDVIIGHAMATDTHEQSGASVTEIGVVVADARQGRGVGSALVRTLARRAQARGATVLLMEVLAENRVILSMITNHFPAARHNRSGPYVTVRVPLPRFQEEQPRESDPGTRNPGPAGCGRQRRVALRTAAGLPVG